MTMLLVVDCEREDDGRWIAEVRELPGVVAYGVDRADAFRKVGILAFRALADRAEHGETGVPLDLRITEADSPDAHR